MSLIRHLGKAFDSRSLRQVRATGAAATLLLGVGPGLFLAVGCAQSGTGQNAGALMAPTSISSAGAETQAKPGSSYDATGSWSLVITGDIGGSGTGTFVQDSKGNISGTDEGGHVYSFKHQSSNSYKLTVIGGDPSCLADVAGTAQLDTTTNTIVAPVSGTVACVSSSILNFTMTFTRL